MKIIKSLKCLFGVQKKKGATKMNEVLQAIPSAADDISKLDKVKMLLSLIIDMTVKINIAA